MEMTRTSVAVLYLVCFVLLLCNYPAPGEATAPAPVPDCSSLILSLTDCVPFVTNNTEPSPKGRCCDGLKSVLQTNPLCLCEAFTQTAQLGIKINFTKALQLPSVCHVSSPPITNCDLPVSPQSAPDLSPVVSPVAPSPSSTPAPINIVPRPGTGNSINRINSTMPATAPSASSSSALASSAMLFLVAMVVSTISLF